MKCAEIGWRTDSQARWGLIQCFFLLLFLENGLDIYGAVDLIVNLIMTSDLTLPDLLGHEEQNKNNCLVWGLTRYGLTTSEKLNI